MSAGIQRGEATTRLGRCWQDWRFHLSALALLAPLLAFPSFLRDTRIATGTEQHSPGTVLPVQAGAFALQLAERDAGPPRDMGAASGQKRFDLLLCPGCEDRIRAIYLHLGSPGAEESPGTLADGLGPRRGVLLDLPAQPNLPGTTSQYPNWQLRLPVAAADFAALPAVARTASIMRDNERQEGS
jgi:hypothetical protein